MAGETAIAASQIHQLASRQHATIAADDQDIGFLASDSANGNYFVPSGKDILLVKNVAAGAGTVTVNMVADEYGRAGAVTTYEVTDQYGVAWIGILDGAYNTSSQVLIGTSADTMHLAVLRLP